MTQVKITDLKVRAIIGINDWERKTKQDVLINITFSYDAKRAIANDDFNQTIDYKALTKRIIREVKASQFFLLEKLTDFVLKIVMQNPKVTEAAVRIDKPRALRFAQSVSVESRARGLVAKRARPRAARRTQR